MNSEEVAIVELLDMIEVKNNEAKKVEKKVIYQRYVNISSPAILPRPDLFLSKGAEFRGRISWRRRLKRPRRLRRKWKFNILYAFLL